MGTMGSRVDINAIRHLEKLRLKEQKASAVGGFNRLQTRPQVMPSKETIEKRREEQAKQQSKFDDYL